MPMSFINPKLNKKRASKPRAFTLMFVPHSGDKTRRLRLPLWALQMLLIVMLTFVGGLSWLGKDYLRLRANTEELVRLRSENRSQAQRIEELAEEAIAVKERLIEVDELDKKVREMLGLPSREPGESALRTSQSLSRGGLGRSVTPADIHDALQGALVSIDPARETLEKLKEDVTKEQHRLAHTPNGWPVRGTISSYFGARRSPFGRRTEFHEGIDIAAPSGTAVKATGAGTVTFAGWYSGYGYMLVIDHGYGYQTAYAHNSKLNVSVGQTVVRGDTIAYVGSSGRSTGPHLHYEVRYLGVKKDPGKYL